MKNGKFCQGHVFKNKDAFEKVRVDPLIIYPSGSVGGCWFTLPNKNIILIHVFKTRLQILFDSTLR